MKHTLFILIVIVIFFGINKNSFTQWIELNSGTTVSLNSGSTNNHQPQGPKFNWVCGNNGLVLKSTNSGVAWLPKNTGIPSNVTLVSICAFDTSLVLTAGFIDPNIYVYRTTNGGNNWVQVFTQVTGVINAVWMRSPLSGFMVGNPVAGRWSLWKTSNGGANWDSTGMYLPQAGLETGWYNSMWCKGDSLWFGTNNFRIYHSSNFGQTWVVQPVPIGSTYSLFFDSPPYYGFAGGTVLLVTTNFGFNWTIALNTPGTGNIVGIAASDQGFISSTSPYYYIRSSGTIYRSAPLSLDNWILSHTAPAGNYTYAFKPRANLNNNEVWGYVYAIRNNGGISGCFCLAGAVTQNSEIIPEKYSLTQNYPNPFNPTTSIKFDLPKSGFVKLVIYDALGREITRLVNQQMQAGSYSADWDAANYPSGVYFYSLLAGDYTETKKMVLVK